MLIISSSHFTYLNYLYHLIDTEKLKYTNRYFYTFNALTVYNVRFYIRKIKFNNIIKVFVLRFN